MTSTLIMPIVHRENLTSRGLARYAPMSRAAMPVASATPPPNNLDVRFGASFNWKYPSHHPARTATISTKEATTRLNATLPHRTLERNGHSLIFA